MTANVAQGTIAVKSDRSSKLSLTCSHGNYQRPFLYTTFYVVTLLSHILLSQFHIWLVVLGAQISRDVLQVATSKFHLSTNTF
jgi:hypothetical protein